MKAKQFDREFGEGGDILRVVDLPRARRPLQQQQRVSVDLPRWMIEGLDKEAHRMGVTRSSVIKIWLGERLERTESGTPVLPRSLGPPPL